MVIDGEGLDFSRLSNDDFPFPHREMVVVTKQARQMQWQRK